MLYNSPEQCECLIFVALHYLAFAGTFVIYSAQVQNAMYDHSLQLSVVFCSYSFGIGADRVEGYEHISPEHRPKTIVKSDDVCIIIVIQILAVYLQYLFVIAEDIVSKNYAKGRKSAIQSLILT